MDRKRAAHAPELRAIRFAAVETNLPKSGSSQRMRCEGFAGRRFGCSSRIAEVRLPSPRKGAVNSE
jgi:hypothetical protein